MQRTIEFPEEQAQELERLATQERRTFEELVQLALTDYLARRMIDRSGWVERFREVVEGIQARIPQDIHSDEIEAEITANFEEYLADQAAKRRARSDPAHTSGH